ncbi:MAG: phosphotransferase enzyme family protein [Nakamurella sp.]
MSSNSLEDWAEQATNRAGIDRLPAHLAARYGITVERLTELDVGNFRVDRSDGPPWVARVFPSARPLAEVQGDADILMSLQRADFPAERCADPEPVSTLAGQGLLVTEFVDGVRPDKPGRTFAILGALLGGLHAQIDTLARPAGGWHQLALQGGPQAEIDTAGTVLGLRRARAGAGQRPDYDRLLDELWAIDDCAGLPETFVHPDFVPANAIQTPDDRLVVVDWAGAGRGIRLWSLCWLLWSAGTRSLKLVDVVMYRYRTKVALEPAELDRLADAIYSRVLLMGCWGVGVGRQQPIAVLDRMSGVREKATAVARRVAQQ